MKITGGHESRISSNHAVAWFRYETHLAKTHRVCAAQAHPFLRESGRATVCLALSGMWMRPYGMVSLGRPFLGMSYAVAFRHAFLIGKRTYLISLRNHYASKLLQRLRIFAENRFFPRTVQTKISFARIRGFWWQSTAPLSGRVANPWPGDLAYGLLLIDKMKLIPLHMRLRLLRTS